MSANGILAVIGTIAIFVILGWAIQDAGLIESHPPGTVLWQNGVLVKVGETDAP